MKEARSMFLKEDLSSVAKKYGLFLEVDKGRINFWNDFLPQFEEAAVRHGLLRVNAGVPTFLTDTVACQERLVVLGSVHGDERSGSFGMLRWLEQMMFARFAESGRSVMLVPVVNIEGFELCKRECEGVDLNRHFTDGKGPKFFQTLKKQIEWFKPNILVDFHEDDRFTDPYIYGRRKYGEYWIGKRMANYFGIRFHEWDGTNPEDKRASENFAVSIGCDSTATLELPTEWPLERRTSLVIQILDWMMWGTMFGSQHFDHEDAEMSPADAERNNLFIK